MKLISLFKTAVSALKIVDHQDRPKLIKVIMLSVLSGIIQTVGVLSVFPFLTVVSDVKIFRDSGIGQTTLSAIPPMQDHELVLLISFAFLFMTIFSGALMVYTSFYNKRFTWNFLHQLRTSVLSTMLTRELDYFEARDSGTLLKHLESDCVQFSISVVASLVDIIAKTILVVGLITALLRVNTISIGILVLVFVVGYSLLFSILRRYVMIDSEQRNLQFEEVYLSIKELFQSIRYVLLHSKNSYWVNRFSHASSYVSKIEPRIHLATITPQYLFETLGIFILVCYISIKSLSGENLSTILPFLGFVVFAAYRLLPAFQSIYSSLNRILAYSFTVEMVKESLRSADIDISMTSGEGEINNGNYKLHPHPKIHLCDVTFGHLERGLQLNAANLTITAGERIAIVGDTGAGKSTLLDLFLGFKFPSEGKVVVNGTKLTKHNRDQWRSEIGFVGQETTLLNSSIVDNVVFGKFDHNKLNMKRVRDACKLACIDEFVEQKLPESYNTIIGESGNLISGGQRQRLGIARALYRNPAVLVLDEATNALDEATEHKLLENISLSNPKLTIICVTHRVFKLGHGFTIYELKNGKLASRIL